MKHYWRILCFILPFGSLIIACSKNVDPGSSDPYPSLDQQRAALSNKPHVTPTRILDSVQIISDLEYLASDLCEGRKPGTAGHTLAKNRVSSQMRAAQIDSFDNLFEHNFNVTDVNGTTKVTNVVGSIKGTMFPDKYIVVTAHYDHLGKTVNGEIYNGADDNASGVACLLALAKYFKNNPPAYSLVFAATDLEEPGFFVGSNHLIYYLDSKFGIGKIVYNLNLDMIARSDNNEIFACGIHYYPKYRYLIDEIQNKTNVKLLMGHDYGPVGDNWVKSSDHYAFYLMNIPFLYIGVEDHPDYHMPTDDVDKINYSKYVENCNMIALMLKAFRN